jgi:hypothetical protein
MESLKEVLQEVLKEQLVPIIDKLDGLEHRMTSMEGQMSSMENQMTSIKGQLDRMERTQTEDVVSMLQIIDKKLVVRTV